MKKKIVIASVLKPVDDVRSFWKLSQSLAKTNKYAINIIGNSSKSDHQSHNISFIPHELSRNNWLKRYFIRYRILYRILKIKPSLLIITDHELIGIATIFRFITGTRIVYDIQENYYKNLTTISPSISKKIYGFIVRLKEQISQPFFSEYWLAEKCYENELSFAKSKYLVLENKAFKWSQIPSKKVPFQMLFSGTISYYSGIDLALSIFKKISKSNPNVQLKIIGQVHDQNLENQLQKEAKNHPKINLQISKNQIGHEEILSAINKSTLGIISYQPNEVNEYKIPTKLYEYSQYRLPYLIQKNTHWSENAEILGGAITVDFHEIDLDKLLETWSNSSLLFHNEYPDEATWEFESIKLINSMNELIVNT